MAVKDFTIKVSGTVAYSDQSHGSFEATGKWVGQFGGLIAQHSSEDSLEHFRQLYADKSAGVTLVLEQLAPSGASHGVVSLMPIVPTNAKTVTSFVMEISGLVAFTDNSKAGYIAQWVNGTVNLYPAETESTWSELSQVVGSGSEPKDFLVAVFEAIADAAAIS